MTEDEKTMLTNLASDFYLFRSQVNFNLTGLNDLCVKLRSRIEVLESLAKQAALKLAAD